MSHPSSTTTPSSSSGPLDVYSSIEFIQDQRVVVRQYTGILNYYDYVNFRVPRILRKLKSQDPEKSQMEQLWRPFGTELEHLRRMQEDHQDALEDYQQNMSQPQPDKAERALRAKVDETERDLKASDRIFKQKMALLLKFVTRKDLFDQSESESEESKSEKCKEAKKEAKVKSRPFGEKVKLAICGVVALVSCCIIVGWAIYCFAFGGKKDGVRSSTLEPWNITQEPSFGSSQIIITFDSTELSYGSEDPSNGTDVSSPVSLNSTEMPQNRSIDGTFDLPKENDSHSPVGSTTSGSTSPGSTISPTVGLTPSIVIALLVTVPFVILGCFAFYYLAEKYTTLITPSATVNDANDLESGCKNNSESSTSENRDDGNSSSSIP